MTTPIPWRLKVAVEIKVGLVRDWLIMEGWFIVLEGVCAATKAIVEIKMLFILPGRENELIRILSGYSNRGSQLEKLVTNATFLSEILKTYHA